jgi:hypothetical protein
MSYLDPQTGTYVPFPLIRLPNGSLENAFSSAVYSTDAIAQGAVGEFKELPFANTADFRAALALNGNDTLKVFSLGGRTAVRPVVIGSPATLPAPANSPPIIGPGGVPSSSLGGLLEGDIFGVPKTLVLIGALAFFFLRGK